MGQSPTVPSHLSDEGKETLSLSGLSFHFLSVIFFSRDHDNFAGKEFLAKTFVHNPEERAEAQVGRKRY